MNREQFRREMFGMARFLLCIMVIFFTINFVVVANFVENDFLFWFNLTCSIGTLLFIAWLDLYKYKIIEGRF